MLKKFRIPKIPSILLCLAAPAVGFFLLETLTHSVAEDMELPLIVLNLIFYYLLYGLILAVSKRSSVSLGLGSFLVMVIGLIDYYVIQFRSVPLYPWDILSVKTAMSVSDNYSYSLDKEAIMIVAAFVLLILIGSPDKLETAFQKSPVSSAVGAERCAVVCALWNRGADAGGSYGRRLL